MTDSEPASRPENPDTASAAPGDEQLAAEPMNTDSASQNPRYMLRQQSPVPGSPYKVSTTQADALRSAQKTVDWYRRKRRRQLWICLFLFLATLVSTTLVGSGYRPLLLLPGFFNEKIWSHRLLGEFSRLYLQSLVQGFSYSGPLMLILLCHEMGHFLQAVRYRVPASFPFFIPLPIPPLGTMGAVIAQGRGAADRKQMFDIAVSGPLAGLLVTIPVLYVGIKDSTFGVIPSGPVPEFGEPLIIQWMIAWIHGPTPDGQTLYMNGFAHAGWVGVLVTALNLIPIGQLDGGHLTYTLLGRPAHRIAIVVVGVAAAWMILTKTYAYILLLILILITGTKHPPTRDDTAPLGVFRHVVGWLTLSFLLIGFTPTPISIGGG